VREYYVLHTLYADIIEKMKYIVQSRMHLISTVKNPY